MTKKALTLTVVANMTANYSEGLGNISTVQKVYRGGKTYGMRSKHSLKNTLMIQGGMYDDLRVVVDGATQKEVNENLNASNCRALEGGYMNTGSVTYKRDSSFYITDAISCEPLVFDTRFHNNLHMARTYAKQENLNVQDDAKKCGLMPFSYEYDKSQKIYSITIDLGMIGKDENFGIEASAEEKADRVNVILDAVQNLSLVVKGELDDARPLFVIGGLSNRMTHYFENLVKVSKGRLEITEALKEEAKEYKVGMLYSGSFDNEEKIKDELLPVSTKEFFNNLKEEVKAYYGVK